jgi:Mn-dependent DtxR family transcriptional regulator
MEIWKLFEENKLTHSAAHHLMAIKEIRDTQGYVRVSDVARHLDITTGSASANIKGLKGRGLVEMDPNKFLVMTSEGEKLVAGVLDRRAVLFQLLHEVIGVGTEQAEIDACKTEHLLSDESLVKLKQYLADVAAQGHRQD